MAVRMQQEAERSRLRGLVFELLRNRQATENVVIGNRELSTEDQMLLDAAGRLENAGMQKDAKAFRDQVQQRQDQISIPRQITLG